MTKFTGGCLCGAIRYEAEGPPKISLSCYCRDCQYVSGGAPAHALIMPSDKVTITKGTPREYWTVADSGTRVARLFCPDCGTPLFARNPQHPEVLPIKVGSLDDPSWFKPQANIWVESAQPWNRPDPIVPEFRRNPSLGPAAVVAMCKAGMVKLGRKLGLFGG